MWVWVTEGELAELCYVLYVVYMMWHIIFFYLSMILFNFVVVVVFLLS